MCAIAGSYHKTEITEMLFKQGHRGPDECYFDYFKKFNYYLGMARLSIIDLDSLGLCLYDYDNLTLTYNGEIYNYIELRRELKNKGYKFTTKSDTEVLLKSYHAWGEKCLDKFNGMFAFAILDEKRKKIFLARDIAGQKPLYFREKDFAFASEAKALATEKQTDGFYTSFQHCLGQTLYKGVKELLPGHSAVYDLKKKKLKIKRWWEFKPRKINPETALKELESLLKDSIKLRTRSDVPYALYFSGGVDSTLISSFHNFKKVTYKKESKKDFYKNIKDIVYHLDFPVGSFSSYGLFWLARQSKKEGFKVLLSGEGADEIFGGYMRYLPIALLSSLKKKYPSYEELFEKVFNFNYDWIYSKITNRVNKNETRYYWHFAKPFFDKYDPVTAMQLFDFTYILPSLLQMGDRMAGMHGLENRCPFLDRRIIEFGLSLPTELKIKGLDTKVILRQLLEKRGLEAEKEKRGLIVSYNKWNDIDGYDRTEYFNYITNIWQNQNSA